MKKVERYIQDYHYPLSNFEEGRTLTLLYDVFQEFLSTNEHRGERHSLENLLQLNNYHKIIFKYQHSNIPYLASVFVIAGYDADWLNIKISVGLGTVVPSYKPSGWLKLDETDVKTMPKFVSSLRSLGYVSSQFYYNYGELRLDIKIFPENKVDKHVLITIEDGCRCNSKDRNSLTSE